MSQNLFPVGSVVLLKNSTKRVMIIGFYQRAKDDDSVLWDYAGCLFPEGYVGADKVFVFNHDQIDRIFMVGYQDEEQFSFHAELNRILAEKE